MKYSKKQIEKRLKDMLYDLLSSGNQESALKNLTYDKKTKQCNIIMNVHIVEEDDYIGFDGY